MTKHPHVRRVLPLTALCAVLVLAGCSSTGTQPSGGGMMGGSSSAGMMGGSSSVGGMMGSSPGGGMMGAPSGYTFSSLRCAAPASLPGRTVTVSLADMGMTTMMGGTAPMGARMLLRTDPASVPAGQVSLVALNVGWRTHELVVLPLAAGAAAGQRVPGSDGKIDEAGSLGEASGSCAAGSGDGITAGSIGWTTITLAPGRYELVCNLTNHYANGMYAELVVT